MVDREIGERVVPGSGLELEAFEDLPVARVEGEEGRRRGGGGRSGRGRNVPEHRRERRRRRPEPTAAEGDPEDGEHLRARSQEIPRAPVGAHGDDLSAADAAHEERARRRVVRDVLRDQIVVRKLARLGSPRRTSACESSTRTQGLFDLAYSDSSARR